MSVLTIVFTDVVGASKMKRDPSLGRDSIERDNAYLASVQVPHNNLIRQCCKEHGGREINTMGDAFYLLFPDPVEAVRCSIAIQEQLSTKPIETPGGSLRLRIGIHTGSPQPFDDDWHGTDVDTAARVEAIATAGQILLSPTTYDLVRHMTDIAFHRMGEFMLKGIDRVILWEADWDGNGPRPTERSPVSLDLDLPPSLRGFIGRSMELAELESLLEKHSAVNVEGLSGIGKTSLTLSLADGWLRNGRLDANSLFYFDCSQRNMHLGVACEFLLRNLAAFFSQAGQSEVANIVANEREPLDHRYNAVSTALMRGRFLVFLDNLQDALDENRRIVSPPLADLLNFVLSRPLGDSRFICASYVQCSWSSRLSIQPFRLKPLSTTDARSLLLSLGIEDLELADRAAQLVGRHPQAIRWFSVLPRELGLSVEEVINDLSDAIDHDPTGIEFHRRIEDELLRRIWETLPDEVGHFLSLSTVYRRPVPFNALCALTPSTEVDRWRQMLLDRFLLDATTREGPHSSHQIVREFALERIQSGSDEWQDAHRAAAKWWQARAAIENYSTREGLAAAIEAHYHLISAGDVDDADALAVRLRPILRTAGWQSHRQGLRDESLAINRALVGMSPNDSRAHRYLAVTLSQRGKKFRKEAESHFRRAVELNPNIGAARIGYAQLLALDGRNEEAERQFQQGIGNNPQEGRSYVLYAVFLVRNKRIEDAEKQYQLGIALNPDDADLHIGYASFLRNRERFDEAETHFQLAVKSQPNNVAALRSHAAFLIDKKRFDEAGESLRAAVAIDPSDLSLRKAYITYLFGHKRIEEARIQLKALSMISPSSPRYRLAYFKIFARYANREEVDSEFKAALIAEPENVFLRRLYIYFLLRHKLQDEAEQQLKDILNANPNKTSVRRFYASFLAKRGRPEEAEQQFKIGMGSEPDNLNLRASYIKFLAMRRRFVEADTQLQALVQTKAVPATLKHLAGFIESEKMALDKRPGNDKKSGKSDAQESPKFHRSNMWNLELPVSKRIATCKAILRENQDDFQANYCLGRTILQQLKDAPSAEPYLRRATDLKPKAAPARFYFGQVLEKLGRFDEALEELNKVAGFVSSNSELHNSRANCLKQLGYLPEAEAAYRLAISDSKGRFTAKYLNNLALLFVAWPDTSRILEGIQLCHQIAQENPTFPWTAATLSALEGRKNERASDL